MALMWPNFGPRLLMNSVEQIIIKLNVSDSVHLSRNQMKADFAQTLFPTFVLYHVHKYVWQFVTFVSKRKLGESHVIVNQHNWTISLYLMHSPCHEDA